MNFQTILDKVTSYALASGQFERVNNHEPKNAPGNGLSAAIWVQKIEPIKSSGLNSTSGRIELTVRIFSNMLQEPQDAIDPNIIAAVDSLMTSYSGDFDLGANVRNVDLLGAYGIGLSAQAAYLNIDGKMYRIMDIVLPVIVNDLWTQVA